MFPVSDFLSAITLAQTFTDIVLGVLPQAQTLWASDGGDELPLVNLFGSVIAQEAQQDGWYRSLQLKIPSAAPFLTTEAPAFAVRISPYRASFWRLSHSFPTIVHLPSECHRPRLLSWRRPCWCLRPDLRPPDRR